MKTWVFSFGPDKGKAIEAGELLALRLRKKNGIIVSESMPAITVEKLPDYSVFIWPMYHVNCKTFSFSESVLQEVNIDLTGKVPTSDKAVITKSLDLILPAGETVDTVSKLVIQMDSDDQFTQYIRIALEHYFPGLTAKKLPGKRFALER